MTQVAALAKTLLRGDTVSIMTCFNDFGITNCPREISRSIEKKFGVKVSKTPTEFTSRFGQKGRYFKYRLNKTDYNRDGIEKMKQYVKSQTQYP